MASIGHGISDAVRNHIPIWADDTLINVLHVEHEKKKRLKTSKSSFSGMIKDPKTWVRRSRMKTATGYERSYDCKALEGVTLTVHSPVSDQSANGYVFCMDGKPIAGGKTKLKSTHVTTATSKTDKTSVKEEDTIFVKFSEEELRAMRTQILFGDGYAQLEFERDI